jgi:hypothetical protein
MSMKKILGLESFPIGEAEIMRRIKEANSRNQEIIEFSAGKRKVRIRCPITATEGVMKEYEDYYHH